MNKEQITLEKLLTAKDQGKSVIDVIELAESTILQYPQRPNKPILMAKHTSHEALIYSQELLEYEKSILTYDKLKAHYKESQFQVEDIIRKYIWNVSGLNAIEERFREKLWSKAWERGHSAGYYEVYIVLCDLLEIFE